jgi:2-oxoglutarate dehydrogenase E1 component
MKQKAKELNAENMAFVRIEQLYPWPEERVKAIMKKYTAKNIIWAQEEPANMGAWSYVAMQLRDKTIIEICRPANAASAEGSKNLHEKRLEVLFENIFSYAK